MTDEDAMELKEGDIVLVACRVIRSKEESLSGDSMLDIDYELHVTPILGTDSFYVEPHSVVLLPEQYEVNDFDYEGWESITILLHDIIKIGGEA